MEMTVFNLDELNNKTDAEIRKIFLTIPITENQVEFNGSFHSNNILETHRAIKALPFL